MIGEWFLGGKELYTDSQDYMAGIWELSVGLKLSGEPNAALQINTKKKKKKRKREEKGRVTVGIHFSVYRGSVFLFLHLGPVHFSQTTLLCD